MINSDVEISSFKRFFQTAESVRLAYAHSVKMFLQMHNKYKQYKNNIGDSGIKKYTDLIDQLFYDKTGKNDIRENLKLLLFDNELLANFTGFNI